MSLLINKNGLIYDGTEILEAWKEVNRKLKLIVYGIQVECLMLSDLIDDPPFELNRFVER